MQRLITAFMAASLLGGCASFPQLDAAITPEARRAGYPVLIPVEGILQRRSSGQITEATGAALQARAANLRARARLLRGVSVDDDTRRRLAERLRRLGA